MKGGLYQNPIQRTLKTGHYGGLSRACLAGTAHKEGTLHEENPGTTIFHNQTSN